SAGVQPGDLITSVDGRSVSTWEDVSMAVVTKANRPVTVVVNRAGKAVELHMTPAAVGKFEIGDIGALAVMHPQITAVEKGAPGQEAGLQPDDVVLAANGERDISNLR